MTKYKKYKIINKYLIFIYLVINFFLLLKLISRITILNL